MQGKPATFSLFLQNLYWTDCSTSMQAVWFCRVLLLVPHLLENQSWWSISENFIILSQIQVCLLTSMGLEFFKARKKSLSILCNLLKLSHILFTVILIAPPYCIFHPNCLLLIVFASTFSHVSSVQVVIWIQQHQDVVQWLIVRWWVLPSLWGNWCCCQTRHMFSDHTESWVHILEHISH